MRRPRIRILPDHVANQIAAGEVVERPASVVKELVENALDAGARQLRIEIERGGKGLVRVEDDGAGMVREDALCCLDRHATSKIRRAEDLREIVTLGFRGEALPSIAAVSRMTIETAAEGEAIGTRLRVLAGRLQGVDDLARRRGTTIEVRNLFLNTPVRARFLRSVGAETRAVSETIHGLALAHLETRFVLVAGGRTALDLPAGRSLRSRIAAIWGEARQDGFVDLDVRRGALRVTGAIQRPDEARPGFRRTHLHVNDRHFRNPGIVAAADRGYRTTVAEGVRPWLFLFLRAPHPEVDVNVHPGKAEVRFRNAAAVESFVEEAVREALGGPASAAALWSGGAVGKGGTAVREGGGNRNGFGEDAGNGDSNGGDSADEQRGLFASGTRGGDGGGHGENGDSHGPARPGETDDEAAEDAPRPSLLQIHNSFILAETREGVLFVDQHAAHERILFERIMADFEGTREHGQRLLFPFVIDLTEAELEVMESLGEPMARLGFGFDRHGGCLNVHTVPSPHPWFDAERCLREMIDDFVHGSDLANAARNQNERVAMTFACKAAIKAGRKLSDEEKHELFDQLFATELPYHDIHGRPTTVSLTLDALRRSFGRT